MTLTDVLPTPRTTPHAGATRPTAMVIFGATGDLTRRKLLPAIYNLARDGLLPEPFFLIGVSRSPLSDDEFRVRAAEAVRRFSRRAPDEKVLARVLQGLHYIPGAADQPDVHRHLADVLAQMDDEAGEPHDRALYLATAPELYEPIIRNLGKHGLDRRSGAEVRAIIEKPFGTTLAEARALNDTVLSVFDESQVFRIDHYLGKETVQNILVLRFANSLLEPIWNRNVVRSVQITAAEDIGIESRAGYYEHSGALRDLVQNHLLQLLCLLCMEPPSDLSADAVRNEKVKVLNAIKPPRPEATVRARYVSGVVRGEVVPGYLDEPGVSPDSHTETYAALGLSVDNWRWAGVPFYLRTGKRLASKVTEIAVTLRPVPHLAFADTGAIDVQPNHIVLRVQPDEGMTVQLGAKVPGPGMRIRPVDLDFLYGNSFGSQSPEAYERLILDALRGDATLFTRNDEVEAQWQICDPIVRRWASERVALPTYMAGSQGPAEAHGILRDDDRWRTL